MAPFAYRDFYLKTLVLLLYFNFHFSTFIRSTSWLKYDISAYSMGFTTSAENRRSGVAEGADPIYL